MSLLLVLLFPLLLAVLVLPVASRRIGMALAPWAALPGLLLAFMAPQAYQWDIPWLLLGSRFGLDETGRLFLLFTAGLWLAAGLYARCYLAQDPRRHTFAAFFLLTLTGNLGVCLALDAASFYTFFALMTFAAYGLVVHARNPEAWRAGRIYLVMALLGESMLIIGLILLAWAAHTHTLPEMAQSPSPLAAGLLFLGFGIKAGVPLLHMWLPLAHPVAPTPASAVLSGAMLKAGLLGWLRFLPLGDVAMPDLGVALLFLGLFAVFAGVAAGVVQHNAKTLLAYSSVSQMGYPTLAAGAGLLVPQAWPLLLPAIGLYALHHALAKGALFLGEGVARQRGADAWVSLGLALPALALAGAPLTSGALVKTDLLVALALLPDPWPTALSWGLSLGAAGTALLMWRFLNLLPREPQSGAVGLWLPWLGILLALPLVWLLADAAAWAYLLSAKGLWSGLWPLVLAGSVLLCWVWWRPGWSWQVPPGDLLCWVTTALRSASPLAERAQLWIRRAG